MKISKAFIIGTLIIVVILGFKFTILQKPDTRLLYTVKNEAFLETIEVSGTFQKTATDTEKAAAYAAYQNAISSLVTAKQNKQAADATMWAKRQAVLNAENNINYKNDNTTNPTTHEDYTALEKLSIDSTLIQAEKDFRSAEVRYKEADVAIVAAQAQVNLTKIAYDDTLVNEPLLTVNVNEIYAPKVAVGQKVTIIFDAMKNLNLTGEVKSIDSVGTITGGIVTFEVKINVNDLPANIKPNMTAIANIEFIHKINTLIIPMSAVLYKDGKTFIQKADSKNNQLTEIKVGEKGFVKVEVLSGLSNGTVILARLNSKIL